VAVGEEAAAPPRASGGGAVGGGGVFVRGENVVLGAARERREPKGEKGPQAGRGLERLDAPAEVFDVLAQGTFAAQADEGQVEAVAVGVAGEIHQQPFLSAPVQPPRGGGHAPTARPSPPPPPWRGAGGGGG